MMRSFTLFWIILLSAFFSACSSDDYSESDVFKVTSDLRGRIDAGVKTVSSAEKELFNEKFAIFLYKCAEMGVENTPYQYMETEEYRDLKNQILTSSPSSCYLLMDRYLKREPAFFSHILNDIVETAYPNTADQISLSAATTVQETMEFYPQLCLEIWLDEIENINVD